MLLVRKLVTLSDVDIAALLLSYIIVHCAWYLYRRATASLT